MLKGWGGYFEKSWKERWALRDNLTTTSLSGQLGNQALSQFIETLHQIAQRGLDNESVRKYRTVSEVVDLVIVDQVAGVHFNEVI